MKLGIIVDSSAGLTKDQATQKGWGFLPLYLNIDGKEYADGQDIDPTTYYKQIKIEQDVKTSATPPAIIEEAFKKASEEFDQVIVYGLSKKLSSQTQNLTVFAQEFDNVTVIDSHGVGKAIVKNLEVAEVMAKEGADIANIVDKVNELSKSQYGIALPATLSWLVKGGRVNPAIGAMANLMKIVPIISFENGELNKQGKGRSFKKAVKKSAAKWLEEIGPDKEIMIYKGTFDDEKDIIESLVEIFGDVEVSHFPPVIANHTGPEVIAFISYDKR